MSSAPLVTVLVTHHLTANRKYLDLCLESVLRSKAVEFEVICLADSETVPEVPHEVMLIHDRSLDTATKKVHHGIKFAHPGSKYFLLLSDDVVVSEWMLHVLVADMAGREWILNPMSNSDYGTRYVLNDQLSDPKFEGTRPIPLHANYEDMVEWREALMAHSSPYIHAPLVIRQDWVCFFCTLIPRTVWEKVGGLDPALETRHNDEDFCYRATLLNIPSLISMAAFAFHFGSKTLSQSLLPGEQEKATEHFQRKWEKFSA